MIDILDDDEFAFVAGHEIGHFLLNHGPSRHQSEDGSFEHYMLQRAREISADRMGLLACQSLDVAIKALMKTISGLNGVHLRFDVASFIGQLRQAAGGASGSWQATHPSILVRCRALLWLSMTGSQVSRSIAPDELAKLDRRVDSDFKTYVDGQVRAEIDSAKQDVAMWSAAVAMASDGVLTAQEQKVFAELFGDETLKKLKGFLSDLPRARVSESLESRLAAARARLSELLPSSHDAEFALIAERLRGANLRP